MATVDLSRAVDPAFVRFGKAALYKAAGVGAGIGVTLVVRDADSLIPIEGITVAGATTIIRVRVSEVSVLAHGDVFVMGGADYKVLGKPRRDAGHHCWIAGVVEV